MGPAWYPRETCRFLVEVEVATPDDFEASFKASEHAPHDALRSVYARIHELVEKTMWADPEETQRLYKAMVLSMQGSWLKRSAVKWKVTRSTSMDDRLGPVQRVKKLDDGSMLLMSSTERLTNHTMYLVGLMALHTEHLLMAKLQRFLRRTPVAARRVCCGLLVLCPERPQAIRGTGSGHGAALARRLAHFPHRQACQRQSGTAAASFNRPRGAPEAVHMALLRTGRHRRARRTS
jgi:hypothetical protein